MGRAVQGDPVCAKGLPVGSEVGNSLGCLAAHIHARFYIEARIGRVLILVVILCTISGIYVPTDFDTKRKALSRANAAEKGLK